MIHEPDHILTQPLLTEDGFINPACMSELEQAIKNLPKTYDRLASDPEWTVKRWIFRHDITGAFAKWAIRQSPYGCPDNLEAVVKFLDSSLRTAVKWELPPRDDGMAQLSLCDINRILHEILYEKGVSYFDAWNVSKTGKHATYAFDGPRDPDTDFIDLDALLHNVCLDIRQERRANDQFDAKFEREWAARKVGKDDSSCV